MKAGLVCYVVLLLLEGFIAFHATGSPMLMAVPLAGLLIYGALGLRSGALAEGAAVFFSALSLALSLMQFQGNLSAIWIGLLSVTHFFAATQAIHEIIQRGKPRDKAAPRLRLTVFSIAFYAALGAAWVVMRAEDLKLLLLHRYLLAGLLALLALAGWELCRMVRLRRAETRPRLDPRALLPRLLAGGAVALLLLFGFVTLLPALADQLAKLSPRLGLHPFAPPQNLPPHRSKENGPPPDPALNATGQNATAGPDQTAAGGDAPLPRRATLQLPKSPRLHLQFERRDDLERLTADGPLYVRSLALGRYDRDKWSAVSENGFWSLDEQDGTKDGRVTLTTPGPRSVAHTLFLVDTDGGSLPALAGIEQFELSKIYTLPDDWHQAEFAGNVRYNARSAPQFFDQIPPEECRAGVLVGYTALPEGKLRDLLVEQARKIFPGPRRTSEAVAALRAYFAAHFSYSDTVANPKDLEPLENFLLEEKKGYCDFFSTAAALLLRRADIPTRVAFGYMRGQADPKTSVYTFLGSHAHSWTEIYLEKHGWVICDFTPPNLRASSSEDAAKPPPGGIDLAGFQSVAEEEKKAEEETKNKEPDPTLLDQIQSMVPVYAPMLATALVAASLAAVLVWAVLRRRREQNSPEAKARRAAAKREKQPAYFTEFVRMCDEFGYQRDPGGTLLELQSAMKQDRFYTGGFDSLSRYYYQTRYEDVPEDAAAETGWLRLIQEFCRERREMQRAKPGAP